MLVALRPLLPLDGAGERLSAYSFCTADQNSCSYLKTPKFASLQLAGVPGLAHDYDQVSHSGAGGGSAGCAAAACGVVLTGSAAGATTTEGAGGGGSSGSTSTRTSGYARAFA
jgi:hypothetical protein